MSESPQASSGAGPTTEARVDPSLAVIDATALPSGTADGRPYREMLVGALLVTSGDGGITLLYRNAKSAHGASAAGSTPSSPTALTDMKQTEVVFPLRPLPPLAGHRPLVIEAAYALASGEH